ncbi:hypothetical protein EV663_101323 [Rhodovulum bhavnagarense]|uniref:Extensin-like C-terminal domain-containing protein n=1 Tax=Rhodovulum bhavnagarense TaxID=992286 RepID=A0A4R2RLF4_9RHOB|nr:extensin family protein [Rhodovulum bhavnagarense]TCP63057.1 hypothetical protein EV663_101323 [Rhodovulum bhavnagarense]
MIAPLAFALFSAIAVAPALASLDQEGPRPVPRPLAGAYARAEMLPRVPLAPVHYNATIRPAPRPGSGPGTGAGLILLVPVHYSAAIRPAPRPLRPPLPGRVLEIQTGAGLARSARPVARPHVMSATPVPTLVQTRPAIMAHGSSGTICGDPAIQGEALPPIEGRIAGCGVARPVRVSSVDGVVLAQPATMECDTARALRDWVNAGVKPVIGRLGGGVASLRIVAGYACRPRNNKPGAKLSEHAAGRAVDVAAIDLRNGVSLSVLNGWSDPVQGKLLRRMHASACGPFGTVLGPDSDGYHRDHFHLDTARYRAGPYCR